MTFEPGQIIDERYRVTTRMGGNQHGSTSKAKATEGDREVVLKKLLRDADPGMEHQLHLAQQAQRLSQQCDELLSIESVNTEENHVYYVLPFLPARSLKRHAAPDAEHQTGEDGTQYFAEQFEWLTRVAKATDFLASQSRVHGDVKPTNILFAETKAKGNLAYLSDIEITGPDNKADVGGVKDKYPGTLSYLAREAFLDRKNISTKSDQYALAVTLYEWLAGELPYKGVNGIDMYKAFKAGRQPITDHCPSLPQAAADALHKALAEEPEQRFETSGRFAAAFIESLPSRAPVPAGLSWQKLSNAFMLGSAAILLLVVATRFLRPFEQPAVPGSEAKVVQNQTPVAPGMATNKSASDGPASDKLLDNTVVDEKCTAKNGLAVSANAAVDSTQATPMIPSPVRRNVESGTTGEIKDEPKQRQQPRSEPYTRKAVGEDAAELRFQRYLHADKQNRLNAQQLFELGQMFENGTGTAPNIKKAYSLYADAASTGKGSPAAQLRIGRYLEEKSQLKEAYHWYKKAANQLGPDAKQDLARFCEENDNPRLAIRWRQRALEQMKTLRQQDLKTPRDSEANPEKQQYRD